MNQRSDIRKEHRPRWNMNPEAIARDIVTSIKTAAAAGYQRTVWDYIRPNHPLHVEVVAAISKMQLEDEHMVVLDLDWDEL